MFHPQLHVHATPSALVSAVAEHLAQSAAEAIRLTGSCALGLSGAPTILALCQLLATDPWANRLDWNHVEVFFSNEICVPPDNPGSGFGLANRLLLDNVPVPYEHIFRIRGEIDPLQAAIEYGQLLKARFGKGGLDIAILELGDDGRVAALLPDGQATGERDHRCIAVPAKPELPAQVTMTATFLNLSYETIVLASGASKARIIQEVLEGDGAPKYPVGMIAPKSQRLHWYMDAAAAAM